MIRDCGFRVGLHGSTAHCSHPAKIRMGKHPGVVKRSECETCDLISLRIPGELPALKSIQNATQPEKPCLPCDKKKKSARKTSDVPIRPAAEWVRSLAPAPSISREDAPVAVVVTCHNYGRFLSQCLESVVSQSWPAAEVILVDDASDDETADIAAQFPAVRYLRVEHRRHLSALQSGFNVTTQPLVLFVDADNWLDPDFIENAIDGLGTDLNVCGTYADMQLFGEKSHRTNWPRFDPGVLHRDNFIDTCTLWRREVLEILDCWDFDHGLMNQDYMMNLRAVEMGFRFEKHRGLMHYRVHPVQQQQVLAPDRLAAGYGVTHGLDWLPVTLFIPLSGRAWAWERQKEFLDRQTFSRERLRVILADTSQDDEFSRNVRNWISGCDYPDVRHMRFSAGRKGLAQEPRPGRVDVSQQIQLTMCRIYNRLRSVLDTPYCWILEDDIIPPDDVLDRMLSLMHRDVGAVTAPYMSRYQNRPVCFSSGDGFKSELQHCKPKQSGVEEIQGSGFGCLLLRSEVVKDQVFTMAPGYVWYDPLFFARMDSKLKRLVDWSLWCEHLDMKDSVMASESH